MAYIAKGRRYTYGIKNTIGGVSNITGMSSGETVFCIQNNRLLTYDGQLWMCSDFIKMTNGSGVTLDRGDLVVMSTTANTITRDNIANLISVVGPVVFGSTAGNPVAIAIFGVYDVRTNDTTNAGDFATTTTANSRATSTTVMGAGVFGIFVEQRGTGNTKCLLRTKQEYF